MEMTILAKLLSNENTCLVPLSLKCVLHISGYLGFKIKQKFLLLLEGILCQNVQDKMQALHEQFNNFKKSYCYDDKQMIIYMTFGRTRTMGVPISENEPFQDLPER